MSRRKRKAESQETALPISGAPVEADAEAPVVADTEAPVVAEAEESIEGDAEEPTRRGVRDHHAEDADAGIEQARALPLEHLRGLIEALVFASDKPHKASEIARLASAPVQQVKALLAELSEAYAQRGIVLSEIAGGWLFRTNAQYAPFVRELTSERPVRLTRAQVETLAIVAYRQPITRPEIDDIRGVDSGATLKLLLERDLIRILGKKDEPGRPLLYGTTAQFLAFFGLKSLRDLPTLHEFTELSDDSQRVASAEFGESAPGLAPPGDTIAAPAPIPDDGRHATEAPEDAPGEPAGGGAEREDPDHRAPEEEDPDHRAPEEEDDGFEP